MDGKPLRDHLENWERQNRKPHPMLSGAPACPEGLDQLWRDFSDLHTARGSNGFAPNALSYTEIDAFQRVSGVRLPAWQIDGIRRADGVFIEHYAETHRPKT